MKLEPLNAWTPQFQEKKDYRKRCLRPFQIFELTAPENALLQGLPRKNPAPTPGAFLRLGLSLLWWCVGGGTWGRGWIFYAKCTETSKNAVSRLLSNFFAVSAAHCGFGRAQSSLPPNSRHCSLAVNFKPVLRKINPPQPTPGRGGVKKKPAFQCSRKLELKISPTTPLLTEKSQLKAVRGVCTRFA